jgi:hypothetical protein
MEDTYYRHLKEADPIDKNNLAAINKFLGIHPNLTLGELREGPEISIPEKFHNTKSFEMIIIGMDDLEETIRKAKIMALQIRERVEDKRDWWSSKSKEWQEGDVGSDWDDYLDRLTDFLNKINRLIIPENETDK